MFFYNNCIDNIYYNLLNNNYASIHLFYIFTENNNITQPESLFV